MLTQPLPALLAMQPPLPEPVDLLSPPRPRPAPPLPLPLPADPDTITGWLTLPANKLTEADAIQRLRGVPQRYENLPIDPDAAAIQSLVSECMTGADELTCFVTMVGGPIIAPYVVLVHCLSPYTAGFGTTSQFQGKTFGFLGECVGTQPPPHQRANRWIGRNREPHQRGRPDPRRGARPLWDPRGDHTHDRPVNRHMLD
jgi:hypothetical protein